MEGFLIQKFPIYENEVRQHNANMILAYFVAFDAKQNFVSGIVGKQRPLLATCSLGARLFTVAIGRKKLSEKIEFHARTRFATFFVRQKPEQQSRRKLKIEQ